jgi:hypothetical protein
MTDIKCYGKVRSFRDRGRRAFIINPLGRRVWASGASGRA